jgi:hypothetical protein
MGSIKESNKAGHQSKTLLIVTIHMGENMGVLYRDIDYL